MVVQLLICKEVTKQPLCFQAIADIIVGMSVKLYYPPLVTIGTREPVVQQSEVRVRLGRDFLRVVRVVVRKGSAGRKIAVSGKLWQPVVVHTGDAGLTPLFDTSVH